MSKKIDDSVALAYFFLFVLYCASFYVVWQFDYTEYIFWLCLLFVLFPVIRLFLRRRTVLSRVISELKPKKIAKKTNKIIAQVVNERASYEQSTLIGTDIFTAKRVYVGNKSLNQHALVLGTTGSGKTTTVLNFVESAIDQGIPVIYIDGKGEDRDGQKIVNYAKEQGRDAVLFSTRSDTVFYNPLASGGFTSQKDRIIELREWSEEHYKKLAEGFLQTVFKIMQQCGLEVNLSNLSDYLDVANLKNLIREHSDTIRNADALMAEIQQQEEIAKDISSLKAEIRNFVNSEIGQVFASGESKQSIELENIIGKGGIVYFSLPATEFPSMTKTLGKLIINDLKASINSISKNKSREDVLVVFDEFSVFAGDQVLNLINQGRSKGVHAVLATQCLSDIARGVSNNGDHFMNQVLENCNTYIIHRLNSADEAERIAMTVGTRKSLKYTAQIDNSDDSEKGSVRAVDEFYIHPNDIKHLPTGNAFYISKTEGRMAKIFARFSWIAK